ncbi:NAD(P)/FAD-dependent oxidoreductase [Myroides pelagicus]|uniref:FAD-dependent oxidoreductase n=1 Tax=Myroides pelagicus TaxID=270914 RepID=A0A7K1GQA4_9FLAO|nr:FAD-dependent oxidoreductase [Myroides pelagicus]MTH30563.1 FAD-dependent oxidoreductase [Myroides pelagicus]
MIDYIVVGTGLAGICFTEKLLSQGKKVVVIDNEGRSSSWIAGGMYNPVVLKRFTEVWKINEQLDLAIPFYKRLEAKLAIKFLHPMPLFRRLLSAEEQNNWFCAADKPSLERFLVPSLSRMQLSGVEAPFGYGQVNDTGYLETHDLITHYRNYLTSIGCYRKECFDYDALSFNDTSVIYHDLIARHIVFAEGFGLLNNPYFKDLPLDGTKGELMLVKIPDLKIDFMLKANVFIIPIGDDIYKVGATYNWEDKSDTPTEKAKQELIDGLKDIINLDFEVVLHTAGVRPTVKDRRPLLGRSLESDRIHVLNGLGTRGVLLAPFLAERLYNNIENGEPLEENLSIHRYKKFKIKK